jgi:hypothetical protein
MFQDGGEEASELSLQSLVRLEDPVDYIAESRPKISSKVQSVLNQLIQLDLESSAGTGEPIKRHGLKLYTSSIR